MDQDHACGGPCVFGSHELVKGWLQISFWPNIPKRHVCKKLGIVQLGVRNYPETQIAVHRTPELLDVEIAHAAPQSTWIGP